MYLWMSTGLPFNATFNYMRRVTVDAPSQTPDDSMDPLDMPQGSTAPQRTARHGYVVNGKLLSFVIFLFLILLLPISRNYLNVLTVVMFYSGY